MSWKCNFSIYLDIQVYYLDIQAITTLLCLLLVIYVLVPSIHSFFYLTTALLKSDISGTQMTSLPTVFNLQASNWVHFEEETGAYYQLSRFIYKFYFYFFIFKVAYFATKKYGLFKKFPEIYDSIFFQKPIIGHTYICTKCIDNFKFTISLKS